VLFAGAVQQQSLSPGHHRAGLERARDPPTLDGEWFATGLTHIHTHTRGCRRKVRKARQGPAKSRHVKRELASGTRNMAEKTLQALPNGAASPTQIRPTYQTNMFSPGSVHPPPCCQCGVGPTSAVVSSILDWRWHTPAHQDGSHFEPHLPVDALLATPFLLLRPGSPSFPCCISIRSRHFAISCPAASFRHLNKAHTSLAPGGRFHGSRPYPPSCRRLDYVTGL
jgi:hypothetical protein